MRVLSLSSACASIAEVAPHPWFAELLLAASYVDAYTWLQCAPWTPGCSPPTPVLLEYRGPTNGWAAIPLPLPPSMVSTAVAWSPNPDTSGNSTAFYIGTEGGGAWRGTLSW